MGWGEARRPEPGEQLASAVREWDRLRTTGSEERLRAALAHYDHASVAHPVTASLRPAAEAETGRPSGW